MRLPSPQPGLQNVLCASETTFSYLSTTSHTLLPATTRPPVHVHAVYHNLLAYATTHVFLESPTHSIQFPQRLHFRPLHLAVFSNEGNATIVIAGPDGALSATVHLANAQILHPLSALPGSAGYPTVTVALNHTFIAAAAMDGRVAIWLHAHEPACHIIDIPSQTSDRVTDLAFVDTGLLIAWWSGRLVLYAFGNQAKQNHVLWDMNVVTVNKEVFGRFPGSYITITSFVIAFVTGRGDLLFVRLADGAHVVNKVGQYVKGMCQHDNTIKLVIDGSLVTHQWITQADFDRKSGPIPTDNTDGKPHYPKGVPRNLRNSNLSSTPSASSPATATRTT